jgi:catechol 2,3-dioxygenase-like lactoylglutathione lyase family enzyme
MSEALACVTLVVRDYDEAIEYFTRRLSFRLLEDSARGPGKRWVVVSPEGPAGAALLLARAATPEQERCVGKQAGGRVGFFLRTDDFARTYERLRAHGVRFVEAPRSEPYGQVVVFEDLYGNRWDLLEWRPAEKEGPR